MPATTTRPAPVTDTWAAAVEQLAAAEPGSERVEALFDVISDVAGADPELARFRFSLLASMRGALASGPVAKQIAGTPRIVVEGIELPGFSAEDIGREAYVRGVARARIFDEELLAASAVSVLLGSTSRNPRQYANKLRLRSHIVGVPHQNQYLYPAFQFDSATHSLRPAVREVNMALDAAHDPWGAASWWVSASGVLGGRAPKDLLGQPEASTVLGELIADVTGGE